MRNISDEEISEAEKKLKQILITTEDEAHLLNASLEVTKDSLREVADYLNDPNPLGNEIEAWDRIRRGNYYGYCIFVHEVNEIQVIKEFTENPDNKKYYGLNLYEGNSIPEIRKVAHGKGCFEQYKLLKDHLHSKYEVQEKRLTQLLYCDSWDMEKFDKKGARKFSR